MKEENEAGRIKKTGERKPDEIHPEEYRKEKVISEYIREKSR